MNTRDQKLEENAFSYQEKLIIFPETKTAGFNDVIEATCIPLIDLRQNAVYNVNFY